MKDRVLHTGTVKQILGNQLIITVLQQSSCDACQIRDACKISRTDEREITVSVADGSLFSVGESVSVAVSAGMGMKAVCLVFGIPLLIVLACVIFVKMLGGTDSTAVAVLFGTELLWYAVLFLFRQRLETAYRFRIERRLD